MKETPLEIIKTLLQYGKVSILPRGGKDSRYTVELELYSGEVYRADNATVELTIEKLLAVLDEHLRKKDIERK